MSLSFALFIGLCYLGFAISAIIEGRVAWAGVGLSWAIGNMLIGYIIWASGDGR